MRKPLSSFLAILFAEFELPVGGHPGEILPVAGQSQGGVKPLDDGFQPIAGFQEGFGGGGGLPRVGGVPLDHPIHFGHGEGSEAGPRRVWDITPDDAPRRVRDITPDDDERRR